MATVYHLFIETMKGWDYRALNKNHSSGHSIWHVGVDLAGLDLTEVQAEGEQLLEAGVDLLMHGDILGVDLGKFLDQTGAAGVVVVLGCAQALSMLGGSLGSLDGTGVGVDGAGALHGWGRGRTCDASSLAAGSRGRGILLLGWNGNWRSLGRAVALGGDVIVDTTHVVVQVPSTWESISRNGAFATLPQAEVGVVSMAM